MKTLKNQFETKKNIEKNYFFSKTFLKLLILNKLF